MSMAAWQREVAVHAGSEGLKVAQILAVLWVCGCTADRSQGAPDPRVAEVLSHARQHLDEWKVPGLAVAIVADGELLAAEGVGLRELGGYEVMDGDTIFRVGSLSKLVTGVLALQEAEAGRLDLGAPASAALEDLSLADPEALSSFSLQDLLGHGSGLQSSGVPNSCGTEADDLERVVAERAPGWDLWTPPGTLYNYANPGYVLVGTAVQRSAGQPFESLALERVLEPAGMERVSYQPDEVVALGNVAVGHSIDFPTGELTMVRELEERACTASFPSGGLMTSARELGRLVEVLLGQAEPWLNTESSESLTSGGWEFSESAGYNHGLLRTSYREHVAWHHGGTVGGYLATMWVLPEEELGVVVLANSDHATVYPAQPWSKPTDLVAIEVLDTFLGLEPATYQPTVRELEDWGGRYAGRYLSEFDWGELEVRREGETLWLEELDTGQVRELWPYSRDRFQYAYTAGSDGRTLHATMKFQQSADGRTEWLISPYGIARRVPADGHR